MGMTADQQFTLTLMAIGLLAGLMAWGLRILWSLSATLQQERDATRANTKAVEKLTDSMGGLSERVARLEGPAGIGPRRVR
jgi:sensor domain CHASE-containing protein